MLVRIFFIFMFQLILFSSCRKFLDVGVPVDKVVSDAVYSSDVSASAVLTGLYPPLYGLFSGKGVAFCCGLSADEFKLHVASDISLAQYFTNGTNGGDFWIRLYAIIYKINAAIEGLSASNSLSSDVKKQLQGEAYFLRAFCYFHLVNLYGDVPLLISSDYKMNAIASRTQVVFVYEQIITDLKLAETLLTDRYFEADIITPSTDRVRPNKWAAASLLARVYLYTDNWKKAIEKSSEVIAQKGLYDTVPLNMVFIRNSKESIWQIQPTNFSGYNTADSKLYILLKSPDGAHPVSISSFLLKEFEYGDQRMHEWLGVDSSTNVLYYYPFKYKFYKNDAPNMEYQTILRVAEQYLIRAEAYAESGELNKSLADLNVIRARAGLETLNTSVKDSILASILHERQVELFTEGPHRWFDMKRTGTINDVMKIVTPIKGGEWMSYKSVYPIPGQEIRLNPNLKQNDGYAF